MLEISIEKNCPIKDIPLKDLTKKFPDFKANILGAVRKEKFIYLKKWQNAWGWQCIRCC